jgi:oligopeptidase B
VRLRRPIWLTSLTLLCRCVLTVYGAYGYRYPSTFSAPRFSLLDRGVTFAVAHVRGGGELGAKWREEGRLLHKMNSIRDYLACARHLIGTGWTTAAQVSRVTESASLANPRDSSPAWARRLAA